MRNIAQIKFKIVCAIMRQNTMVILGNQCFVFGDSGCGMRFPSCACSFASLSIQSKLNLMLRGWFMAC